MPAINADLCLAFCNREYYPIADLNAMTFNALFLMPDFQGDFQGDFQA